MFLFLISKGANILDLNAVRSRRRRRQEGKTALELAKEHKKTHILEYIKEKFGKAIF